MMQRFELTDEQWERLQPLLPQKARTGRPATENRQIINGVLWSLRTLAGLT
jgi:transposase